MSRSGRGVARHAGQAPVLVPFTSTPIRLQSRGQEVFGVACDIWANGVVLARRPSGTVLAHGPQGSKHKTFGVLTWQICMAAGPAVARMKETLSFFYTMSFTSDLGGRTQAAT